ncbi:hypothetical protein HYV91_00735 [Candidatus Wolfebacteria bacterium]|nr:hypothetical protein [Candidatus Wolfebacteria bacterium]
MNESINSELSKSERKALKREEKMAEKDRAARQRSWKKFFRIVIVIIIVITFVSGLTWYILKQPKISEAEFISTTGLHWHPELSIFIKGKKQEIPGGVGLGVKEQPMHTHEPDGVIHLEFPGLVARKDTELRKFFEIWGKKLDQNCISASGGEFCTGLEGTLRVFINGQETKDFLNYPMRDKDKIEIRFE